jgi:serpin B
MGIALLALAFTTSSCRTAAAVPVTTLAEAAYPGGDRVDEGLSGSLAANRSSAALSAAVAHFGVDLLRAVRAEDPVSGAVVSPFSVYSALALMQGGARGATLAELRQALHTDGLDLADVDRAYADYLGLVHGRISGERPGASGAELHIANSLWLDEQVQPFAAFLDRDRTLYGADIARMDLQAPGAVDVVNRWVAEHTGGHIMQLLTDNFDGLAVAVLANAIYLKASWSVPMEPENTKNQAFHRTDGTAVDVPMMHAGIANGAYRATDSYVATHMDLSRGLGHMAFYLPRTGFGPDDVLTTLADERSSAAAEHWDTRNGELFLPRFEIDWRGSLEKELKKLGIKRAFDAEEADFGAFAPIPPPILVSKVVHASTTAVNEQGVEASAATVIELKLSGMGDPNPPAPFRIVLDRPFVFELELAGMPMFLGVVEDPRTTR